jgi:hypothetical protein
MVSGHFRLLLGPLAAQHVLGPWRELYNARNTLSWRPRLMNRHVHAVASRHRSSAARTRVSLPRVRAQQEHNVLPSLAPCARSVRPPPLEPTTTSSRPQIRFLARQRTGRSVGRTLSRSVWSTGSSAVRIAPAAGRPLREVDSRVPRRRVRASDSVKLVIIHHEDYPSNLAASSMFTLSIPCLSRSAANVSRICVNMARFCLGRAPKS